MAACWPFASPEFAFPLVAEGDTIRVAPGIVDYGGDVCYAECYYSTPEIHAGIVLIGDTLPDGTRPILRTAEPDYVVGLPWYGGQHGEVKNLVMRGFYQPLYLNGLRSLVVDNVRIEEPATRYGYGIYVNQADTIRIRRSELLGDPSGNQSYQGLYVADGAGYVEVLDSRFWYWGDGAVYGDNIDSLEVLRNDLSYGDYTGIYVNDFDGHTVKARISANRFLDNYYEAVRIYGAARVALDHNYIYQLSDDVYQSSGASGPAVPGSRVTILRDSIRFRADDYGWIDASDLDSVLVDSLWLENPADTAIYQYGGIRSNYARITNSRLLNLYYQGVQFDGGHLVVDNTEFTGCAVCTWNAGYAVQAYPGAAGGPRVSITNSRFFNIQYGVYSGSSNSAAGPMVIANNNFDSVATGVYLYGDSLAVTDNRFLNVRSYAAWGQPSYTTGRPFVEAQFLRNQVTCAVVGSDSYGLRHDAGPARFENNAVRNCRTGLLVVNASYPTAAVAFRGDTLLPDSTTYYRVGIGVSGRWQATIVGNRMVGGYYGMDLNPTDSLVPTVIDSNSVSGASYAGIQLYYINGPVTGRKNNVGGNANFGIYNYLGNGSRSFTLGRFVGNAVRAVYNQTSATFDATQNWWGNADFGAAADTVLGPVDVSNWLTSDPADVPALAPRPPVAAGSAAAPADLTVASPRSAPPAAATSVPPPDDRRAEREARRAAKDAARESRRSAPGGTRTHDLRLRRPTL